MSLHFHSKQQLHIEENVKQLLRNSRSSYTGSVLRKLVVMISASNHDYQTEMFSTHKRYIFLQDAQP